MADLKETNNNDSVDASKTDESDIVADACDNSEEQSNDNIDAKSGNDTAGASLSSSDAVSKDNESDNNDKTNLIVNYLPQLMTDADFKKLFTKFGTIKSCKIVRHRMTGYSYGFGFVDFETHEQSLLAINELNGHELENKKIKVAFARPAGQDIKQANLYIKNVPDEWTEDDVRKVFAPYGNIIQVRVLGNNRGIAFVLYDLRKQAEDALAALNGKKVDGCESEFEIKFAADKKSGQNSNNSDSKNNNSSNISSHNNNTNNNNGGKNFRSRGGFGRNRNSNNNKGFSRTQNRQPNQQSFNNNNQPQNNNYQPNNNAREMRTQYQMSYGNGGQVNQFNGMGVGPVRHNPTNRMNRYTPFVSHGVQQQAMQQAGTVPMMQMAPPAYGYPNQPQMVTQFQMAQGQPMGPIQTTDQTGQMVHTPMSMYGAATSTMPMGFAPVYTTQQFK